VVVTRTEGLSIYFAGAIRGGRQDADWYGRFVVFLSQFGTVLTEHVGNAALLSAEQVLSETEIFERDMAWLKQADLVIAEVTTPSLGVGYELGVAEALDKRVLCLFRGGEGLTLSAMVAGNPHFETREYHDFDAACVLIKRFIYA
jgi:nucleoside 2-deoxyribosyltransferase